MGPTFTHGGRPWQAVTFYNTAANEPRMERWLCAALDPETAYQTTASAGTV